MIVVLSNEFEGGELLVRHGAREEEFEFEDAAAGKAPCYAAFLWRLQQVKKTKRTLNQLAGGIITIGSVPAPIQPYSGPTTRGTIEKASEMVSEAVPSVDEEESLRNVSRGDMTPLELLFTGLADSRLQLHQILGTAKATNDQATTRTSRPV